MPDTLEQTPEQNADRQVPPGGAPQSGRKAGPSDRELQRAALRELVRLSSECATEETAVEDRHKSELAQEEKDFERQNWAAEQRAHAARDGVKQKYDERAAKIESEFAASTGAIREADQRARRKIQNEHAPVEADIKKKYDEAIWLADAELEARTTQIRLEQKKAKEDQKEHEDELGGLEDKARRLLEVYNHRPTDTDPAAMTTPEGEKPEPGNFAPKRDVATAELARLQTLFAPRLFVGATPWTILFVLLAAAGGGTYLYLITHNQAERATTWQPYAVVCGAVLVAAVAIGVTVSILAKATLRRHWTRTRKALDDAFKANKYDFETKLDELGQRLTAAKEKRAGEAAAAKEKFSPMLAKVQEKKKAAFAAQEEETAARMKSFEEKRQQYHADNDAWRDRHLADVTAKLEREVEHIHARHAARLGEIEQRYVHGRSALEKKWKDGLAGIARPMAEAGRSTGQIVYDWTAVNWDQWTPPREFATLLRFGELQVDLKQITDQFPRQLALPKAFSVPANLAFPSQSSLLIHTDRDGRPEAIATLQMVMARLLTGLPAGRVKFTIIDPVGLGQNFAGFMHLADHDESLVGSRIWTEREHIEQRLLNLTEHMETVIQKYLRNEYETIDEYNAQAGELAEPYRFLVIADFPVGFEGDSFRRLSSIASTGARCGVYTLVIRDTRVPLPSGAHFDELEQHSVNLVRSEGRFAWKDEVFKQFPLQLDAPPAEDLLTGIMDVVGKFARDANRVEVPFEQIAPRDDQEFWSQTSRSDLHVPVGRMGATRQQYLRLGRGVAQHCLIAGKTGSGKSTLLHAIITNLAMWYRPDEIELYLIDFKKGVEFKTYATHELPHARAIAVESDREFGLSVLQRLDAELTRRGEIFRKLGIQDLASYRDTQKERREEAAAVGGQAAAPVAPSGNLDSLLTGLLAPIPRTLLIIDEFQEFFSEDDKLAQDAAVLIDRLVRQGRAFGIHVLLGSQTIGGSAGLSRATIGQMAVRVALQTSEADSQLILGDGNSAARLLSRPGEAIYNDAGGLVEGNSPFQVAWLPDEKRDEFLERVLHKTREQHAWFGAPAVVFEGNAPADVKKNARMRMLLSALRPADGTPPPVAPVAYLGEPVAIKDPTGVALRRQSGANVLIVGQQDEGAMALMQSMAVSLAAQHSRTSARFVLMDGTPADSHLAGILDKLKDVVPQDFQSIEYRAVDDGMAEVGDELKRRQEHEDPNAPAFYLFIFGLQRYRVLRKSEDSGFSFGSSSDEGEKKDKPDKIFSDLLRDGPHLGMHVIAWIDTPVSIERTLDRGSMREFDNRILFQMSANDSSNLIDSPAANKLGMFRALAYSEEQGTIEKFRPYALLPHDWLADAAARLRHQRG